MRSLLFLFLFLASTSMADEVAGHVVRIHTVEGFDDNDVVQILVECIPPLDTHYDYRLKAIRAHVDDGKKAILVTPVFVRSANPAPSLKIEAQTLALSSKLKAGLYRVSPISEVRFASEIPRSRTYAGHFVTQTNIADRSVFVSKDVENYELKISNGLSASVDNFIYAFVEDLSVRQTNSGPELSIEVSLVPGEELHEIKIIHLKDQIVALPIITQSIEPAVGPAKKAIWRTSLRIPEFGKGRSLLFVKSRALPPGADGALRSGDKFKFIDIK